MKPSGRATSDTAPARSSRGSDHGLRFTQVCADLAECLGGKRQRSKQIRRLLQIGNSCDEALLCQDREILVNAFGRISQTRPDFAQRRTDQARRERKLVPEKVVGVLGLDAEGRESWPFRSARRSRSWRSGQAASPLRLPLASRSTACLRDRRRSRGSIRGRCRARTAVTPGL